MADGTRQGSYVSPPSGSTGGQRRPYRRAVPSRWVIVAAGAVGVALLGFVVARLLPGSEPRELATQPGDDWEVREVLGGSATIRVGPAWEDLSEMWGYPTMDLSNGFSASFDGVWITAQTALGDEVAVHVMSTVAAESTADARDQYELLLDFYTADLDMDVVSETAILTTHGLEGSVAELSGGDRPAAIGYAGEGADIVLVLSLGSSAYGSGVQELEAILNSVTLTG